MKIKNVTIAGGGTLGSQIAWQTAFMGFNVIVYDAFDKGLETSKNFHKQFAELFSSTRRASNEEIDATLSRLSYTTNLADAVRDADIISESIPENMEIKKGFYEELAKVAPEKTIFTTNSSTTLPSDYAKYTGRPEKFLALHFANGIWDSNVGEVMGHSGTDPKVYNQVVEFAEAIGMVPIKLKKEQPGYVLNSLLLPLLFSAVDLLKNGVSDHETIDKTWMIINNKVTIGPCATMDVIGLQTMYNIADHWSKMGDAAMAERAAYIKKEMLDKGKLGLSSGKGFYEYPNPKYADPDFLK
ncbi:3-hydroxyacyl-CoA dehydrogenase [Weeksellaceae bacterium KMM 9713]|uniref:3-hydroxyacyl-CoA dehydrogenase n=1 Tax=Profundicola chukchiensis TaxID=2961959 RepID=A0A9X4MZK2_9FLAO|nr:3-hydroxyacyl-CoA dehydrogenase [Profundicola chukchiensis]MDG4945740.1 3-hydroxyacyl-CoA dehydrogenase [Profundicola chukchiensis]